MSQHHLLDRAATAFDNLAFDLRFGTDTHNREQPNPSEMRSANFEDAVGYMPTNARVFRSVMSSLDLPADSVFVDVGSGKGKVLMLATSYEFKEIVGIEVSKKLCDIARRNLNKLLESNNIKTNPRVIHSDIVDYHFSEENVFFMYNPFHTAVMKQFIGNISRSISENPRDIWIIYHQPFTPCRAVIEAAEFREIRCVKTGSAVFRIYRRRITH